MFLCIWFGCRTIAVFKEGFLVEHIVVGTIAKGVFATIYEVSKGCSTGKVVIRLVDDCDEKTCCPHQIGEGPLDEIHCDEIVTYTPRLLTTVTTETGFLLYMNDGGDIMMIQLSPTIDVLRFLFKRRGYAYLFHFFFPLTHS